jgi:hypothetical protein
MRLANRFAFKIEFADQVGLGKDNKDYQAVCRAAKSQKYLCRSSREEALIG